MSKRFTRNIINIEKIEEQGFDTNTDGDLLLTKDQQAYIRLAMSYHCLTDNVKVINGLKPDKDGNVNFKYVEKVLTESEGLTLSEDDKNNMTLTINLNEKWLADFIDEHGGASSKNIDVFSFNWSPASFVILTRGDTSQTAVAHFLSYNNEWDDTDYIDGVYYSDFDATMYTLENKSGKTYKNLSVNLSEKGNETNQLWSKQIVRADISQTNEKAPDYIDGMPDFLTNIIDLKIVESTNALRQEINVQIEEIMNRLTALENKG